MSLEANISQLNTNIERMISMFEKANWLHSAPGTPAPASVSGVDNKAPDKPKDTRSPRKGNETEGEKAAQALVGTDGDPALYDYETVVKPKLMELNAVCGREELVALLARFGVAKVTELKVPTYPEAVKLAQKSIDAKNAGEDDPVAGAVFDPLA